MIDGSSWLTRLIAALSLSVCIAGCGRGSREARCERPSELASTLDLNVPAQQQHLRDDAHAAEALALTYADAMEGADGVGQHRQAIERCEATLLSDIARVHRLAPERVRMALGRQNDTPF